MPTLSPAQTLGSLVAERESRADVLEHFGLDYCCGGATSLADACAALHIPVSDVLKALEAETRVPAPPAGPDWRTVPLGDLIDHIVSTHHAWLRETLPRAGARVDKIARVHCERHAELWEVRETFLRLQEEMLAHLKKEEDVIFPGVRAVLERKALPDAALKEMTDEHELVGSLLHRMRDLTSHYGVPADGCPTYRAAMADLAALERDTHQHVHKENNILLPRARDLASRSGAPR